MKSKSYLLAACLVASLLPIGSAPAATFPQRPSPPGQIYVVSANSWQRKVIGVKRFKMMLELTRAVLKRPVAFDAGDVRVGAAPDLIVLQEMQPANLEIFANLLRQRSDANYQIAGSTEAFGKFLINQDRIAMQGEAHVWNDVCYEAAPPNEDGPRERNYQWAEFMELETGARFTAASIHLDPRYTANTGQSGCWDRNVPEIRRQMDMTAVPSIIAGDFNKRAVQSTYECDPQEESEPLSWYSLLTTPQEGRVYTDAVKDFHRAHGLSLASEWTHEQKTASVTCDAATRFRRTRIDYMFTSGMGIGSAHADHPGWAGPEPGSRHPVNKRYSDHRFVAGRFSLVGPAQPAPPVAVPRAGGAIDLSWTAPEVPVAEWLLYRATGSRPFALLGRFPAETVTFQDLATAHGQSYRYALAAVDAAGAQGLESDHAFAVADAVGPKISVRVPRRNASGVDRRADVIARYDERIDPTSVSPSTINLFGKGSRLCGSTTLLSPRVLVFDPCFPLGKRKGYRVVVYAVLDELGNRGPRDEWEFTTR